MDTLTGTVDRITYSSDSWTVLTLGNESGKTTAVGAMSGVRVGESLEAEGQWVVSPRFGRQFKVTRYQSARPTGTAGVAAFLASAIDGVGPALADRIVDHFGVATLWVLDTDPSRLSAVKGISAAKAAKIGDSWSTHHGHRDAAIFLQGHGGVTATLASKIVKEYGERTVDMVIADPYRLVLDIERVGFTQADAIAQSLGVGRDSPARIQAAALHCLREAAARGHTCVEYCQLANDLLDLLGEGTWGGPRWETAIEALDAGGSVVIEDVYRHHCSLCTMVYLRSMYEAEQGTAAALCMLHDGYHSEVSQPHVTSDLKLAEAQQEAVRMALDSGVSVITGGPGTGKTTIVRSLCDSLEGFRVELCAPTGRAAKRLSEATGRPARTIHRLLKYNPEGGFQYGASEALDCDVVIVDEVSMVDARLMHSLVSALRAGMRLVLVGDKDQLPSVGAGSVLAQVIESGVVPVVHLTTIFRQAASSAIICGAHDINKGLPPIQGGDLLRYEHSDEGEAVERILQLCSEDLPRRGIEDSVQVLTPMKRGALGTEALNEALQERLNPPMPGCKELSRRGTRWRVGDRVMQTRNNYELDVFNGELGIVKALDSECLTAQYGARVVSYSLDALDQIVLAYATTIHKSQGSEYQAVVIVAHSSHRRMLERQLLYTAVTRGKKIVAIVGESKALEIAVENNNPANRETLLADFLQENATPPLTLDDV